MVHGGNAEEQRGVLGLRRLGHGVRFEAGEQNGRGAGQQGAVDAHAQSVGMEHGQGMDQAVVGLPAPGHPHRLGGGQQVPVPQDGSLRCTGRARRVADEGRVIRSRLVKGTGVGIGQVDVGVDDLHRTSRGPSHPVRLLGAVDDGGNRAGVEHHVGELALGVGHVGRDHHQPGPQGGDVGHQRRNRRGSGPHHPISWHQSGTSQSSGHLPGGRLELAGGPPPALCHPPGTALTAAGSTARAGWGFPQKGLGSSPPAIGPGPREGARRHQLDRVDVDPRR